MIPYEDIPEWGVGFNTDVDAEYLCVKPPDSYGADKKLCDLLQNYGKSSILKGTPYDSNNIQLKREGSGWDENTSLRHDEVGIQSLLGYYDPDKERIVPYPSGFGERTTTLLKGGD